MAAEVSVPVHFHVQPSDALIYALMERARIFVFPPIEDFGMVAVEAMATGTPVMANRVGGSGESVQDGIGGAMFDPSSPAEIRAAAEACAGLSGPRIAAHAQQFDATEFDRALYEWVSPHIAFARFYPARPLHQRPSGASGGAAASTWRGTQARILSMKTCVSNSLARATQSSARTRSARSSASRSSSGDHVCTSAPVLPSSTDSAAPPTAFAMTGVPDAIASTGTIPKSSMGANTRARARR